MAALDRFYCTILGALEMPFLKALKLSRTRSDNPKSKSFRSAFVDSHDRFVLSVALKNVLFHLIIYQPIICLTVFECEKKRRKLRCLLELLTCIFASYHTHVFVRNSRYMRFPTMWYVRPAKAQTSLCILPV